MDGDEIDWSVYGYKFYYIDGQSYLSPDNQARQIPAGYETEVLLLDAAADGEGNATVAGIGERESFLGDTYYYLRPKKKEGV